MTSEWKEILYLLAIKFYYYLLPLRFYYSLLPCRHPAYTKIKLNFGNG